MISDVYFPRVNGVSTSIQTFHRHLTAMGHEITLLAPSYGPDDESPDWLRRVPSRRLPLDPEDRMMHRGALMDLDTDLSRANYDIVHVQTPFVAFYAGIGLARRMRLPCVVSYHTHFEEYLHHYLPLVPRSAMRGLARWFARRQCNRLDTVIVPSAAMEQVLKGYGVRRPIEVIATGLDEEWFQSGDGSRFRRLHGIEPDRPLLLYVGRVAHEKNIDFLLEMLIEVRRSIPRVLLVIAGEGPALRHLRRMVNTLELGSNVRFLGYLERNTELLDCYASADLFVFASRTETQGLVLLEAMAQGLPVVGVPALGTADILVPDRGALIAAEQTGEFARQVIRVLQDAGLRTELSAAARSHAGSWSAAACADKAAGCYTQTIHRYHMN